MKRDITQELLTWKEQPNRKPLVLKGVRQCGKTYILKEFYHHGRACGVVVYQRQILRFEPVTSDNCYITADGDMLFSYRGQFATQEEAERFLAENDVLFSLCFGPVLIDDGVDVTPTSYQWGEINDTYARSALGLLDRHHYLTTRADARSFASPGTTGG